MMTNANNQGIQTLAEKNQIVLAVAGQLLTGIIQDIAGNDISTCVQGTKVTNTTLMNLMFQRIRSNAEQDKQLRVL